MGDLTTTGGGSGLVGLLHSTGGLAIPKPFEREIHLFDSHVAGTTHIEGIDELEPHLEVGEKLLFFREPENPYDPKAIMIQTETGTKIGYVPEKDNLVFARLMDAGKQLFGRIKEKETRGNWLRIQIGIYLQD